VKGVRKAFHNSVC